MPDAKCSRCGAPAEDSDLCTACAALDLTARKPAPAAAARTLTPSGHAGMIPL